MLSLAVISFPVVDDWQPLLEAFLRNNFEFEVGLTTPMNAGESGQVTNDDCERGHFLGLEFMRTSERVDKKLHCLHKESTRW